MAPTPSLAPRGFWRLRLRVLAVFLGLGVLATTFLLGSPLLTRPAAAVPRITTQWLQYHGDALGGGVAVGIAAVNTTSPVWTSPTLNGQIYGEPLVYDHEIIVATENNVVYSLSARTGAILWARHVAPAVPQHDMPCGNIGPTVGITGTPVIDATRHEVFLVAFEIVGGTAVHYIYGLNADTGATMMHHALHTPTADQTAYLQRSGLALDNGSVIFTLGGNYGDCGTYHGVVAAVREDGSSARSSMYVVDSGPGQREGAVWMGGAAPVVDAQGDVWVESGNGSVSSPQGPYDHSDAVLELSSSMRLKSFFAPTSWASDNASDADLSAAPALTPSGYVVASGKSGDVYLLNSGHLGG